MRHYQKPIDAHRSAYIRNDGHVGERSTYRNRFGNMLTAQDNVASAQSTVDGAWRDLFTARNSYRWAVETGQLSQS